MSEGPVKKVKMYAIPVHLLDLDGDLTVHCTRKKAIEHYICNWAKGGDMDQLEERIDDSWLGSDEKNAIKAAMYDGVIPEKDELDFQAYLEECEDVCHYEVLEMKI